MEITCKPIPFGRWYAELWSDGTLYASAIGPRPGCAIRDAINEFCLRHDAMPDTFVKMQITEWD